MWKHIAIYSLLMAGCGSSSFQSSSGGPKKSTGKSAPNAENAKPLVTPGPASSPGVNASASPTLDPGSGGGGAGVTPQKTCSDPQVVQTKSAYFPAKLPGCLWLGAAAGTASATSTETVSLNLGGVTTVCDVSIAAQSQSFVYDDGLILTLNNHVLVSSIQSLISRLTPDASGLLSYNWFGVRGTSFVVSGLANQPYCFNAANCQVPKSQEIGPFVYTPNVAGKGAIQGLLKNVSSLDFKIEMVGDDDPGKDCSHNAMSFTVTYSVPAP